MSQGWISIHRQVKEWEWYGDSKIVHLFLHCLMCANHKPKKWRGIQVDAGQFITSRDKLASELPLSVQQVRTALNKLKSTGEITIKTTTKYSMISITNWSKYQESNQPISQQVTNNQPSNNQQVTTNNNDNNANNENNDNKNPIAKKSPPKKELDYTCWPYLPEQQIFDDWLGMRKTKKAKVSQTVVNQFGKKLHAAVSLGYTVDECIAECVTRNWTGFEIEWMENSKRSNAGGINKTQQIEDINRQVGEDWLNGRQ